MLVALGQGLVGGRGECARINIRNTLKAFLEDMFTNIKDMFTNSCEQLLKLLDLVPRQFLENELSTSPRDILLLGVSRHDGPSRAPQRLEAMDLVPNSFGGRVSDRQTTRITLSMLQFLWRLSIAMRYSMIAAKQYNKVSCCIP